MKSFSEEFGISDEDFDRALLKIAQVLNSLDEGIPITNSQLAKILVSLSQGDQAVLSVVFKFATDYLIEKVGKIVSMEEREEIISRIIN
jgi:hypothetical protein